MVCAVGPGLHEVTLAGRILQLRDLKLREDGHLRVTNVVKRMPSRHTFRQSKNLNTNQRLSQPPSTVQVQ